MDTLVFERGDYLYIVGSVAPVELSQEEIEEFAFSKELRSSAPNDNLLWLRGQYVEGDISNRNGQTWSSKELAIKSLTPRLMPVTVMHDPRTAVGLIADTKLLTPEAHTVPRSRIETDLAVWAHRFPEVAAECAHNYKQGTLMQSMECVAPSYDCVECGRTFAKLPKNAERANWCSHLTESAEKGEAPRRLLRGVTFTGTGLIFGTRSGATGADSKAHLEIAEEVAEFHERAKSDKRPPRRTSRMEDITLSKSEYDALVAKAAKADELASTVTTLEETASKVPELEKSVEKLELDVKKVETERDTAVTEAASLKDASAKTELASDRIGKLGSAFTAKLTDGIKSRLGEQAKVMSEEDWTARLEELVELVGVKHDEGAPAAGGTPAGEVSTTETASTQLGAGGTAATEPSRQAVSTVMGGLFRQTRRQTAEPAKK